MKKKKTPVSQKTISKSQTDQFRWLADNSTDIIHVLDSTGVVTYINPALKKILGYKEKEMLGKNAFEYVHPDDMQKVTDSFSKAVQKLKSNQIVEMRIRHKNGSWVTFEVASKTVVTDSGEVQLIINSRDITERKKLEQMKEEFLSFAAHELKTPITVIKLLVQNLMLQCQKQKAPKEVVHNVKIMDKELIRLTRLINDILDVSKLESGIVEFNFVTFDFSTLIHETVQELKLLADQKIKLPKQKPLIVYADRDRTKQVLINLLSNSMKYSKKDGTISIRTVASNGILRVEISDEGEGISKDKLIHLFDRFFQVKTKSSVGTGLGLYITKEIITQHKGDIWVTSEIGKGSTFSFTLPLTVEKKNNNLNNQSFQNR